VQTGGAISPVRDCRDGTISDMEYLASQRFAVGGIWAISRFVGL
jgi:hypothetical protein